MNRDHSGVSSRGQLAICRLAHILQICPLLSPCRVITNSTIFTHVCSCKSLTDVLDRICCRFEHWGFFQNTLQVGIKSSEDFRGCLQRSHLGLSSRLVSTDELSKDPTDAHPKACALFRFQAWQHHKVQIKTLRLQSLISFCAHCIPMEPTLGRWKTDTKHLGECGRGMEKSRENNSWGKAGRRSIIYSQTQDGEGAGALRDQKKVVWNGQQPLTINITPSRGNGHREQVKKRGVQGKEP